MAQSPTIVVAHLSDEALKNSVKSLVNEVNGAVTQMASNFDAQIKRMEDRLNAFTKSVKDKGGSASGNSGGSSTTQATKHKEEQKEVGATTQKIKEQTQALKEKKMTYDQVLGALQMAQRQERVFAGKNPYTLTREELDKYAETLTRVTQLQGLLNQKVSELALKRAEAASKSQAFDAKGVTSAMFGVDERLKQLNKYYAEEEKASQKRAKAQQTEAANVEKNAASYDKLAASMQKVVERNHPHLRPEVPENRARDSYMAFEKRYAEQANQIAARIQNEEAALNKAIEGKVSELNQKVEAAKQKLSGLYTELARVRMEADKSGNYSTFNAPVARTQQAIENTKKHIAELQAQIEKAPQGFQSQVNSINALRAQHERLLNAMKEEAPVQRQVTSATETTVNEQKKQVEYTQKGLEAFKAYREEIQRAAHEMRGLLKSQPDIKHYYTSHSTITGEDYRGEIFAENDARAQGLTIEEQILRIMKERQEAAKAYVAVQQQSNAEAKKQESQKSTTATRLTDAQYLRQQIATLLEVQDQEIKMVKTETASYKELSDYLNQLQKAYKRLGGDIIKKEGSSIASEIQKVQRAMQKLQSLQSRPLTFTDAMKGEEKTLDDIAYKIQRLQAYMRGLDSTNGKSANEIKRLTTNINLLKEKETELMSRQSKLLASNQSLFASNTALGRSWNYAKNRLAFYLTVSSSMSFVKNLVEIRSQYEMNERALGILIDSAERGTQIFSQLSEMSLVSPYTLIELSAAAKQLVAYDVAAKDVVDTTRRLADMASAVGIPMERLTYALGQIKAYGYLNSRDARMFANAGIPLVKQLSDYYTELEGHLVSTGDIYDRIKKKAIDYNDVMNVVNKMTDEGGKFFDFQAKMADTLKVQLANLTLAWNNMLNDIGSDTQGTLSSFISVAKDMFLAWKDIKDILIAVAVAFGVTKVAQMLATNAIGKQTIQTLEYVSANKLATWQEYKRALSLRGLTAEQAKWLILSNQSNKSIAAAIVRMGLLDAKMVRSLATMGAFRKGTTMLMLTSKLAISGLIKGVKALGVALKANWPMMLMMLVFDIGQHLLRIKETNKELNKSIAEGAQEATKAIGEFLQVDANMRAKLAARNKKLTKAEGEKAWDAIREQLELSAASANSLIPKLIKIPGINERVTESFALAERIQKATEALSGLEDELKISQDSVLYGLLGEGLDEDLEDYTERIRAIAKAPSFAEAGFWDKEWGDTKERLQQLLQDDLAEATKEIKVFADDAAWVIKERLGEEGIKDSVQVGEAVARVLQEVEKKFPKIRGTGKTLFESVFSQEMSEAFKGYYSAEEQHYKIFLEQLKKDHGSAFKDVTDIILEDTHKWEYEQFDAIRKTAEKLKKDMPQASRQAIDAIQKQLNSETFKLRIIATMGSDRSDEVRKAFEKRFYKVTYTEATTREGYEEARMKNVQRYQAYMMKAGEDNVEYEKRMSDEKEKQQKIVEKNADIIKKGGDAAVIANAKAEKEAAELWIKYSKEVEDWGGYNFTKDKKGGNKKDPLLEAIKQTIDIIKKAESEYDTLTQKGATSANALESVYSNYGRTLDLLNDKLAAFGLSQIDLTKLIKGKNPNEVLAFLKELSNILESKGLSNLERQKVLEVAIQEFSVKAKTYNLDKITKGLNSELDKLKDEYELAIELDANPELGDMFLDMFGINTSAFPKTIDEYMQRVQQEFDKMREKRGFAEPLEIFKADDAKWESWGRNMGLVVDVLDENGNVIDKNTDALDTLTPKFKEAQGVAKKWATDVVNNTKKLEYELAELNDKIVIKEKEQAQLHEKIEKEKNETTKHYLELTYQSNEKAIDELRSQALSLMPEYARVFNSIAEYSAGVSRRLQRDLMRVFDEAKYDSANKKWTLTGSDGKQTILNDTQYRKEREKLTKEMRKSQAPFKKIKEAFKPSDKNGVVDYAKGIELVGGEIQKLAGIVKTVGDFAEQMGLDRESVEVINDVATSLEGVASASDGISKIAAGDYIGGAASILSGVTSVIGTWLDNEDNRINDKIKKSERAIKRLENSVSVLKNAYDALSDSADRSYGIQKTSAQLTMQANKKLQLQMYEMQMLEARRQLNLERSRSSKKRDQDKIIDLEGQIISLQSTIDGLVREVSYAVADITDELLGISRASWAEELASAMIDAFRSGEDYMQVFEDSWDDMVNSMIGKMIVGRLIGDWFDTQLKEIDNIIQSRTQDYANALAAQEHAIADHRVASGYESAWSIYEADRATFDRILTKLGLSMEDRGSGWGDTVGRAQFFQIYGDAIKAEYIAMLESGAEGMRNAIEQATDEATIEAYRSVLGDPSKKEEATSLAKNLEALLEPYGIAFGDKDKTLSDLQQGIQGVTEDTAGAIEAYLNGVSQQVYYQSEVLTEIRDAVVMMDFDVQTSLQSQMLLQLQSSYQTQQSIKSILEGVLTPNARAFSVELVS